MPPALDFPNPPLTVGQQYAAPTGVLYAWDGAVWTAGPATTGLPPTGAAGGDLTGTYPNPTIGPGAVGNAEISDVAYSKVTGAPSIPTTLPPSGTAGGSLAGSYPNPTLTASGVTAGTYGTTAKIPQVTLTAEGRVSAVTELTVAPTGGSPTGAAGGALAGTYPNPTVAASAIRGTPSSGGTAREIAKASLWGGDDLIDGSVPDAKISALAYSKLTGAPTSLPPSGSASGDLTGTYPGPTIGAGKVTTAALAAGATLAGGSYNLAQNIGMNDGLGELVLVETTVTLPASRPALVFVWVTGMTQCGATVPAGTITTTCFLRLGGTGVGGTQQQSQRVQCVVRGDYQGDSWTAVLLHQYTGTGAAARFAVTGLTTGAAGGAGQASTALDARIFVLPFS